MYPPPSWPQDCTEPMREGALGRRRGVPETRARMSARAPPMALDTRDWPGHNARDMKRIAATHTLRAHIATTSSLLLLI